MLSKSLIQFSVDGQDCVPSFLFGLRSNYGRGHGGNGDFLPKGLRPALLCSVTLTLQQATVDPCLRQRLLDTRRQLAWKIHGQEPGRLQSMGSLRVGHD